MEAELLTKILEELHEVRKARRPEQVLEPQRPVIGPDPKGRLPVRSVRGGLHCRGGARTGLRDCDNDSPRLRGGLDCHATRSPDPLVTLVGGRALARD